MNRTELARSAQEQALRFVLPPDDAASLPTDGGNDSGLAGVEGNSRLTSVNGLVLLVLLAVEGLTILSIERMISVHLFVGVLLVGPIVLKSITTGYRFVRYYARGSSYVRKGPPHPVLRVLGPIVLLSSLAVLGTGIALGLAGPNDREPLLTWHQVTFAVWFGAMTLHVLGHTVHAGAATWRELHDSASTPTGRRRAWRGLALAASLAAGIALAAGLTPAMHAWIAQPTGSVRGVHDEGAAPLPANPAGGASAVAVAGIAAPFDPARSASSDHGIPSSLWSGQRQ